jgi:hypothetical protein
MSFMVVDVVTDEIVESNFEYKHHAELFIEVHGKDYPDAELIVESCMNRPMYESQRRLNARKQNENLFRSQVELHA